jgi:Beta-ketoacyl synthase, N-terminal domain
MTPASVASRGLAALHVAAAAAGLTVFSSASWPETDADREVPALAGFIESDFSPLLAEVAGRALSRRALGGRALGGREQRPASGTVTAVVMVTALGDVSTATRVAAAVDAGERVSPLLFFQSVPNAVAGYLAARWQLTGPVVCISGITAGLDVAALLIADADADEALVVRVDLGVSGGTHRAAAILVTGPATRNDCESHEL